MSGSAPPVYGPQPWVQRSWDARAAGNFIGGGAGAGLLVFAALSGWRGGPAAALWLTGMALVSGGLLLVWLEIGRPARALNVFLNPQTSWMSRESFAAVVLLLFALLAVLGVAAYTGLVAALALAFVYCQARILRAAKGIVAWREPLTTPLVLLTGLTEGGGLFCLFAAVLGNARPMGLVAFAAVLAARTLLARSWFNRVQAQWGERSPRALQAMTGPLWHWGGLLPLAIVLAAWLAPMRESWLPALWALAGALAAAAGVWFKFHLVTRAAFNQGFSLAQLPVRGVRRTRDAS